MIIKQLNLDHFGKFHDTEIHLEPGINVVYGANESGKSTIHSFIQCMLFGAERLRGRGSGRDIYSRFQPWDGGGSYEGRMNFDYQGKSWRIVRNFHKDDTFFTLIDEQEGREVLQEQGDISSLIRGMTLSNYRNSISTGQLSVQPDSQFVTGMQSYMANMALGAEASVDVGKAMDYLKDERKKASARISEDEFVRCQEQAEALRKELEERESLIVQQKQMEKERAEFQEKIQTLELQADDAMKVDRKERMRAIQLIQENNDVAAMYKAKKAELRELEASAGNHGYQKRIQEIMDDYEGRQERLEDKRSRCSELEEQNEGSSIRNLALILPVAAAAAFVWIAGGIFGLKGIAHVVTALVLAFLAAALAVMLFRSSGSRRRRIIQLQDEAEKIESEQQAILEKYGIKDIEQLRASGRDQQSRQEAVLRLRKEMEVLRERYNKLQEPLQPYLDKYGDSITRESSVGQAEKKQIEQLRRQMSDVTRQYEQLEWRLEQLSSRQAELSVLEEKMQQMKMERKSSYEDMMAIDISQNAIKEITAQIHGSFGSQLADYVSQLFSYITDGAHQRLTIDEKFQVQVDDRRRLLQPQQLSAGTVDQIYFSIRMAVSQMFFDEPMPLILDDSFVLYDDMRLQRVLTWLAGQDAFSQIIIFTCHHREADVLQAADCPYHLIEI
ncbi:MAG: ATP-binding protein [Coprococcus sp.]